MLEKIREGHFATLFSEGLEWEDELPLPPPKPPPASGRPLERARRLASLLARRAQPEPLQARESAAT